MQTLQSIIAQTSEQALPSSTEYADWVDLYGTGLYRLCCSLTFCTADAEDLFQDTFLDLFLRHSKGKVFSNPQAHLYSTAYFLWKSAKRKYARRQRIAPTGPLDDSIAADSCFEDAVENRQTQKQVRQLVAALPNTLRVPVSLYYGAGMPLAEVARTMSIAEGTVKSRLHKARKVLAKGLGDV